MTAAMDQELERQERRLGPEIFKAPIIKSLVDIKRVLVALDPTKSIKDNTALSTVMNVENESGIQRACQIRATAPGQTRRDILVRGFTILQNRLIASTRGPIIPITVNGLPMASKFQNTMNAYMWVDPLLARWLGATRDGLYICWVLASKVYKYDIFQHKLYCTDQTDANT